VPIQVLKEDFQLVQNIPGNQIYLIQNPWNKTKGVGYTLLYQSQARLLVSDR
jgi:hypothetical protein